MVLNPLKLPDKVIKAAVLAILVENLRAFGGPKRYNQATGVNEIVPIEDYFDALPQETKDGCLNSALSGLTAGIKRWL